MNYNYSYSIEPRRTFIDWQLLYDEDLAVGNESALLKNKLEELVEHYFFPFSRIDADPKYKFYMLKQEWEAQTAHLSSITDIAMNTAYQQIIGMGKDAIPFILAELKKKPDHWFWALKSITGDDPISPDQRGRINLMRESWLNWGRKQDYLK